MRRKGQRGATLIEVMVAGTILTVTMAGFAGTITQAARSSGVADRRTAVALLRSAALDRISVIPRDGLTVFPSAWQVDRCFDAASQEIARNGSWSNAFSCPDRSVFRTWLRVVAQTDPVRTWRVSVYAEKIEPGCTAANASTSLACATGDLFLTD